MYYKYRFARKACSMIGFCTFFFFVVVAFVSISFSLCRCSLVICLMNAFTEIDLFCDCDTLAHTQNSGVCVAVLFFFSFEVIGCWSIIKLHIVYNHSQFTWYYGNFLLLPKTYQRQLQFSEPKEEKKKSVLYRNEKRRVEWKYVTRQYATAIFFLFYFRSLHWCHSLHERFRNAFLFFMQLQCACTQKEKKKFRKWHSMCEQRIPYTEVYNGEKKLFSLQIVHVKFMSPK